MSTCLCSDGGCERAAAEVPGRGDNRPPPASQEPRGPTGIAQQPFEGTVLPDLFLFKIDKGGCRTMRTQTDQHFAGNFLIFISVVVDTFRHFFVVVNISVVEETF